MFPKESLLTDLYLQVSFLFSRHQLTNSQENLSVDDENSMDGNCYHKIKVNTLKDLNAVHI